VKNDRFSPLAHPVILTALLLVLVNALFLQHTDPTWLSGKLGDAAWMIIAPVLIASAVSFLAPDCRRRKAGLSGILITGISFSLLKTVPALNHLATGTYFALFHIPLKLALDPSDLLILPFLGLSWLVWNSHFQRVNGRWLRAGSLTLALLALVADSPAPQPLGFTCLLAKDNRIYAFRESLYKDYFSGSQNITWLFYTTDGGMSWTRDDQALDTKKETCTPQASFPVQEPGAANLQYYFVPGKGIYTSQDGGKILTLGQEVEQVTSVYMDTTTGNAIFAAGRGGVLVQTPDGKWQVTLQDTEY
jgi:hypothetical protein